jgi:hypothetical protein
MCSERCVMSVYRGCLELTQRVVYHHIKECNYTHHCKQKNAISQYLIKQKIHDLYLWRCIIRTTAGCP